MLISMQGSDVHNGIGSSSDTKGTFSKEDGGMIKAFGNYMTGQKNFEPYAADDATFSRHFDAYVAENRNDQVPAEVTTLQGGTGYNNFDTASDFYAYTPDDASDVPAIVMGQYGAGRCQKGDFRYTFDNATQDTNDNVITDLSNQLANYTSSLVKIYGDMGSTTHIRTIVATQKNSAVAYHLTGRKATAKDKGLVIRNGRKLFSR